MFDKKHSLFCKSRKIQNSAQRFGNFILLVFFIAENGFNLLLTVEREKIDP